METASWEDASLLVRNPFLNARGLLAGVAFFSFRLWRMGCSPSCNWCSCGQVQDEFHVLLMCKYEGVCVLRRKYFELFQTLPGDFSLAQPFLRQQLSVQAVFDRSLR
eukprot:358866-Pelagomonas_calceolata.AAC.5